MQHPEDSQPHVSPLQMIMRAFLTFLLVLLLCHLSGANEHGGNDVAVGGETQRLNGNKEELELQVDIQDELRNLLNLVLEQRAELKQLTQYVTATERLVDDLQKENTAQAAELRAIKKQLNIMQKTISVTRDDLKELQNQQEARKIAFSTSLLQTGNGNTIYNGFTAAVFRNVFTNIGNHYSPITGYFTAPVRGVYYFRFTGQIAESTTNIGMRLVKNEEPTVLSGDCITTSTDLEDNVSNGAVLELDAGDVVSIQIRGEVWDDHYHRTTFTGFLLFVL